MSTDNTKGVEALGSDGPTSEGSPVAQPGGVLPPPSVPVEPPTREVSDVTDPDAPVLVGVAFQQRLMAQEYLMAMSRLRSDGALRLKDAVIVEKRDNGDVKVTETIDPTPGRSALNGAMWTGLLGLFVGGPVGWLAGIGIGAGAGAVTAKVIDLGIPDDWVDWFKQVVQPGHVGGDHPRRTGRRGGTPAGGAPVPGGRTDRIELARGRDRRPRRRIRTALTNRTHEPH